MASRSLRPCGHPGCPELVKSGYCEKHRQSKDPIGRASAVERGYNYRWQRARAGYLRKHPLCVECLEIGRVNVATVVDHIIPHRGDKRLFWDKDNWQPLCKHHHDRKTASGR